jgi:putative cell wall-binding protein
MRKTLITTLVALTATGLTLVAPAGAQASATTFTRLSGADRYATAVEISKYAFQQQSPAVQFDVMVASGTNFPDALAAGPVAASLGGPLLLVPGDGVLPTTVSDELTRLTPFSVTIAGGTTAVSSSVQTQLNGFGALFVERMSGLNRYETAAQLADLIPTPGTIFIATGASFPDALGGSAAAGALHGSLMLTDRSMLSAATAAELTLAKPSKVVVLGGTAVVDPSVLTQIQTLLPTAAVERWSGADRYATAAEISSKTYPLGAKTAYLASGASYPDALAGAPVAAMAGAPLLLTSKDCVPASTMAELTRLGATDIVVLGGPAAVSDAAANLTPCP